MAKVRNSRTTSNAIIIQHIPIVNKKKKLKEDEFYVEKIINHKGRADKRSTMKFFVKWLGYDDSHNSWIPWSEARNLAALDTYLKNNVDVLIPVEQANVSIADSNYKTNKILIPRLIVKDVDNDVSLDRAEWYA